MIDEFQSLCLKYSASRWFKKFKMEGNGGNIVPPSKTSETNKSFGKDPQQSDITHSTTEERSSEPSFKVVWNHLWSLFPLTKRYAGHGLH
jgi:hypothetical protein